MNELDSFYLNQNDPLKSCLLALRSIITSNDPNITNEWKYKMPFFCYKGKMFCYLWVQKSSQKPYIGIVEGNRFTETYLIKEKRSRMKIMLLNANEDLPISKINYIIKKAINLYKSSEKKN